MPEPRRLPTTTIAALSKLSLMTMVGRRTVGTALREWPRWRKAQRQRWRRQNDGAARPVFVVGTQRSGTTMLLEVLDRSNDTTVYHEYHRAVMDRFRLRPAEVVNDVMRQSAARVIVMKPLTESQWVDRLLGRFPDGQAIWVFRRYQDVANSAIGMWPSENTRFAQAIRDGTIGRLDWQGERVSDELVRTLRPLVAEPLTEQEGASLFWYARNHLYFELGLDRDPRVLLVRYESLVTETAIEFGRVFEHLGIPFDERFVSTVTNASLGRRPFGPIQPDIQRMCDEMLARLESARQKHLRDTPVTDGV